MKKRIVISGTYCTGKTTLSLALSYACGLPATHALTMREILPLLYPGKSLRQCSYTELITLGMRRFEERIRSESKLRAGFVSDGCTLQEWLYGSTRLITGAYPDEYPWKMKLKRIWRQRSYRDFVKLLRGFEGMAKAYAATHYDIFFHLPIEFDFVADGHRPTSEAFRQESERRLLLTYGDIGIKPHFIQGSIEQRLRAILEILDIEPLHSLSDCIAKAEHTRTSSFDRIALET